MTLPYPKDETLTLEIYPSAIEYTFNPHLIPTFRGLLSSIYIEKKNNVSLKKINLELCK